MFWTFKWSLIVYIFPFFGLETVLATLKNWVIFFSNILVTLIATAMTRPPGPLPNNDG